MPDTDANLIVDTTGNTAAIATDYVNNTHFQVNKLAWGSTGESNRVSASYPLPVKIESTSGLNVGITGSVTGLGNFKVINGTSSTLIVSGTTSSAYTPVQVAGLVQGITNGVLVGITGTVNVNSVTILGGSTMSLINPIGITGGRNLSYLTDSISITGSTVGISIIPNLLQSKDSIRVYSSAGATLIPVNIRDGSGNLIGSSGGALNVNIVGAGITATVNVSAVVGVCQSSPFYIAGATYGPELRIKGTKGAEESLYVKFYENPTIQSIANPVTVDLTNVMTDTYLIKQKLDTLITTTSGMILSMLGGSTGASINPLEAKISSINIPSIVYTGTKGITAGSSLTLSSTSLKTGITIKNRSSSDVNIQGNGTTSDKYSLGGGEIIFIETNNLNNISFNVNSGSGTISYIAT